MHSGYLRLRATSQVSPPAHYRHLFAHFSKSLLWHVSCLLFAFFLTEQCQLAPVTMAGILGLSLACNAVLDVGVGAWFRRYVHSVAAANRCQQLGAAIAGAAFILFAASCFMPVGWTIVWAMTWLTIFRCGYPLVDVAQNAQAARIGRSRSGCRAIVAQRHMASGLAAITVATLVAPGLIFGGETAAIEFFAWSCLIAGLAWIGTLIQPDFIDAEPEADEQKTSSPASSLGYGHALMLIFALGLIGTAFTRLAPYYLAFAAPTGTVSSLFLSSMAVGSCGSQMTWVVLRHRLSEKVLGTIIGCALLASSLLMMELARTIPLALGAAGLLMGIGCGGVGFLAWSAMAESTRRSHEYFRTGLFTACSKLAQALSILAIGLCFAAGPYRETLGETLSAASLLIALAPFALGLSLCGIMLIRRQPRISRASSMDAAPSGAACSGASAATSRAGSGAARSRRGGWLTSGHCAESTIR